MQAYLPKDAAGSSGYTEGGALYALGLIHVNHGAAIIDYLVQQLKEANNEVFSLHADTYTTGGGREREMKGITMTEAEW